MSEVAHESTWPPVAACLLLSSLFVGSLYVWGNKHDRNHPSVIKRRFFSVFVVILICPFVLKLFITSKRFTKFTILELVGFRMPGILPAAVLPLILTMVLFLGPICMLDFSLLWSSYLNPQFISYYATNLIWLRNVVVGPFSEEFTFRACMVPLLLHCFKPLTAIFVSSFMFGLAHVHHVIECYKAGIPYNILVLRTFVQFSYTTVFGTYSAYVFLQTGHFIAPFVVHAFCNVMTFPDFELIFTYDNPKKSLLILVHVVGVVLWYLLLPLLLNHELYSNYVYFNDEKLS